MSTWTWDMIWSVSTGPKFSPRNWTEPFLLILGPWVGFIAPMLGISWQPVAPVLGYPFLKDAMSTHKYIKDKSLGLSPTSHHLQTLNSSSGPIPLMCKPVFPDGCGCHPSPKKDPSQQMEATTENHSWTQCREACPKRYTDISTAQLLHLETRKPDKRGHGKI